MDREERLSLGEIGEIGLTGSKQLSKEKWLEVGKGKETGLQKQHTS